MSMISAQIDELRKYADRADGTFPMLASALRDAADTICEIRGALQVASVDYRHLADENAKLRELVIELWVSCPVHDSDCDECQHKGGRTGCELYDRLRELGVEVDG